MENIIILILINGRAFVVIGKLDQKNKNISILDQKMN